MVGRYHCGHDSFRKIQVFARPSKAGLASLVNVLGATDVNFSGFLFAFVIDYNPLLVEVNAIRLA